MCCFSVGNETDALGAPTGIIRKLGWQNIVGSEITEKYENNCNKANIRVLTGILYHSGV